MALESATYINQLREDAPSGLDPKSQGDDHLRLIKGALKRTFPNITAPVTATAAQINGIATPGVLCPTGMIAIWCTSAPIPAGWVACDGVQMLSNGWVSPNLMDVFLRGWGHSGGVGHRAGSEIHGHTVSVTGTALNQNQIPSHTHTYGIGTNDTTGTGWVQASPGNTGGGNYPAYQVATSAVGLGHAHDHGAFASNASNIPPFVSVIFIIKT